MKFQNSALAVMHATPNNYIITRYNLVCTFSPDNVISNNFKLLSLCRVKSFYLKIFFDLYQNEELGIFNTIGLQKKVNCFDLIFKRLPSKTFLIGPLKL